LGGGSSCSLQAPDAPSDASDPLDRPVQLVGIGRHGPGSGAAPRTSAEQRVEVVIDPRRKPHDCLKSGSSATPTWQTIFDHYGGPPSGVGTKIEISSLGAPQLARNGNFTLSTLSPYWTGDVTGISEDSDIEWRDFSGQQFLRVYNREGKDAGAAQRFGSLVKPNKTYTATVKVANSSLTIPERFRLSFYADPTTGSAPITRGDWGNNQLLADSWKTITVQFTTPNWTESQFANAIVIVQSDDYAMDFYIDDLSIVENTAEKYIYRQVLNSAVNPFGSASSNGIYWIDCGGATLVIERSRIVGTLLVLNPGASSRIGNGPIHWSPAAPGYPILLVNGNFSIQAINNADLSEVTSAVNFNPVNVPYFPFAQSTDAAIDDTYPANEALRGLIAISGNLTYQNSPQISGRVVVGGSVTNSPTFQYRPDSLINPPPPLGGFYTYRYDLRPASIRKAVLP
jgi:hypothetical protein